MKMKTDRRIFEINIIGFFFVCFLSSFRILFYIVRLQVGFFCLGPHSLGEALVGYPPEVHEEQTAVGSRRHPFDVEEGHHRGEHQHKSSEANHPPLEPQIFDYQTSQQRTPQHPQRIEEIVYSLKKDRDTMVSHFVCFLEREKKQDTHIDLPISTSTHLIHNRC